MVSPFQPALRQPFEIFLRRESFFDRLCREGRFQRSLGPQPRPPLFLRRRLEAPSSRGHADLVVLPASLPS